MPDDTNAMNPSAMPDMLRAFDPGLVSIAFGAAVGDALGVPYEFRPRHSFRCSGMVGNGTHNQPAGTWSDDTALLLATCDSIKARGGLIDTADMLDRFRRWIYQGWYTPDGTVFDYGNTTARALGSGRGCDDEHSNGNGSLMRIAPLACTDATDDEIRAVSAITHAHETSTEACVMFVHIVRDALADASKTKAWLQAQYGDVPRRAIKSGGYVVHTLNAALWCLATTDSYAECVLAAVNLGGDTDTTACVAGALAGAVYGYDAIPTEWIEAIRNKDVILGCLY